MPHKLKINKLNISQGLIMKPLVAWSNNLSRPGIPVAEEDKCYLSTLKLAVDTY